MEGKRPEEITIPMFEYEMLVDMHNQHQVQMEQLISLNEESELQLTRMHLVAQAAKIGLWDIYVNNDDPGRKFENKVFSKEFRQLLGYENEKDFPNGINSWLNAMDEVDIPRVMDAIEKHVADKDGKTGFDVEYRMRTKDGQYAFFRDTSKVVRNADGVALHIVGALQDVSESKNLILEATNQKIRAENANIAKSNFLSTMSHEIRTPMNVVIGITEIQMQNDDLPPETREAFEMIYTSGDLLLSIINDLLDLSKIEADKMELVNDKYEIPSLVSDTAQLNMMRIGDKDIEFELHVDETVPRYMLGDMLRIKQILNNLLSNSFKYTNEGTVKLYVKVENNAGENGDDYILIFTVEDTGLGMTPGEVAILFEEYTRFDSEVNHKVEGTGLGMSITRRLIQMMNGEIQIESEKGVGTAITVRLPQGSVGADAIGYEAAENLRLFRTSARAQMRRTQITREKMPYGKVLVVDDIETNVYVARGLLNAYDISIESVLSGFAAIDKIEEGNVYDIIFMDHMMPELDGIETVQRIRDIGYNHPIVALTANAGVGQAALFMGRGFDGFISKPIDIHDLDETLNKFVRDKQPPEILEAIRRIAGTKAAAVASQDSRVIDPVFAEIVVRDATKSLTLLQELMDNGGPRTEAEMRVYVINTHGMKSALANIDRKELSTVAQKLEHFGRKGEFKEIINRTPGFLDALRKVIIELSPQEDEAEVIDESGEDKTLLAEKLAVIKAACEEYDESIADDALTELRESKWSAKTKEMLSVVAEHLLHSNFDEIVELIDSMDS